jgi:hypothetical protein
MHMQSYPKSIKCLHIILVKYVQGLYFKTLLREIKENLNKWRDICGIQIISLSRKPQVLRMLVLIKLSKNLNKIKI